MCKPALALGLLLLAFCALGLRPKYHQSDLVGLWQQMDDYQHSAILRRADGTFIEKGYKIYDASGQTIYFQSAGVWSLRGGKY